MHHTTFSLNTNYQDSEKLHPCVLCVNSCVNPGNPFNCKHKLIYVDFTCWSAILLEGAISPACLRSPISSINVWGRTFISPAETVLLSKHVYTVVISSEICPPDFTVLVNMFPLLRHFTLLSTRLHKCVRFIFRWVKIYMPLTRYYSILA